MTEILLLEIYTNIAINCHDTCCYLISLVQLQPLFRISYFCISVYFIIVTLVVVAFDNLHSTEMKLMLLLTLE